MISTRAVRQPACKKGWSPLGHSDAFRGFSQPLQTNAGTVRPLSFSLFQAYYPLLIQSFTQSSSASEFSKFRSDVEVSVLLECGTALLGDSYPTFRDSVTRFKNSHEPRGLETSDTNYPATQRHIPEKRPQMKELLINEQTKLTILPYSSPH